MVDYRRMDPQANLMLLIQGMLEEDIKVEKRDYNLLLVVFGDEEDKCAYPSKVLSSFIVWR